MSTGTLRGPDAQMAEIREAEARGRPMQLLPFWGHRCSADGTPGPWMLSQWAPVPFEVDGVRYPHAESWMMVAKAMLFGDADTALRITEEPDPAECKRLGRSVRGFDQTTWDQHCYRIVARGNWYKFSQNQDAASYLLSTAPAVMVEASPYDRVWGAGIKATEAG